MALRTARRRCVGEMDRSFVFQVTRRAGRSEDLVDMMNRGIVAGEAGGVADLLEECCGTRDVTKAALLSEDRVRRRERAAGIGLLSALRSLSN